MSSAAFDAFADAYEAMIDWKKRLAHEEPFYCALFARIGARSVLDVACGAGHHAAMFNRWGLRVQGADTSPAMIERCRSAWGEGGDLSWAVRSFDEPVDPPASFDIALCVGNSLALARDPQVMSRAVSAMVDAVRPGGAVVVHVLNLWRLPDGPCQWQKSVYANLAAGRSLIIKGVHRSGDRGFVDLLVTNLDGPAPAMRTDSAEFAGIDSGPLEAWARAAGARDILLHGDYRGSPYLRDSSTDLILVAVR